MRSKGALDILYVFLLVIAEIAMIIFIFRPILNHIAKRVKCKNSLSPEYFLAIMSVIIAASYVAEMIGLSALFGAFQIGLVLPREGFLVKIE